MERLAAMDLRLHMPVRVTNTVRVSKVFCRVHPFRAQRHSFRVRSERQSTGESSLEDSAELLETDRWIGWLAAAAGLLAAGLVLFVGHTARASEQGAIIVGQPRVVDGDTLVIGNEKIRLFGLDAPESKQSCSDSKGQAYACGKVSGDALRQRIGKAAVQCEVKSKDMYGRNVASCSVPGTGDLGSWLVKNGHAVAYRQYAKVYVDDETSAKSRHEGIWQGDFQIPADWRKEQKANPKGQSQAVPDSPSDADFGSAFSNVATFFQTTSPGRAAPSPDCQIKGNVSSSGQKIYHMPGGRYFAGVKIEPEKGESYFCTEKDAQAAGFRASRE